MFVVLNSVVKSDYYVIHFITARQIGFKESYFECYPQLTSHEPQLISFRNTMTSLFFSTPVDIDVVLEGSDDRETVDVKLDKGRRERVPLYMDGESVKGAVTVRPKDGKRLEHTGIKVQFIGTIGWDALFL